MWMVTPREIKNVCKTFEVIILSVKFSHEKFI